MKPRCQKLHSLKLQSPKLRYLPLLLLILQSMHRKRQQKQQKQRSRRQQQLSEKAAVQRKKQSGKRQCRNRLPVIRDVWEMDYTIKNQKTVYLSAMRALACISVVILHSSYTVYGLHQDDIGDTPYLFIQIIVQLCMWAVPAFVMVTGALLLDPAKEVSAHKLFCKYIKRVFTALVLCGMLFRVFDMLMNREAFSAGGLAYGFREIYTGASWSHLWYLYLILGLYFLLPFYKMISAHASHADIRYLLVLMFMFFAVLPISDVWGDSTAFYINAADIYPFYLFLGYAMHSGIIRIGKRGGLVMLIAGIVLNILTAYFYYGKGMESFSFMIGYSGIPTIVLSAGAFACIQHCEWRSVLLQAVDRQSFGIYLIHLLFVRLIFRYMGVNPLDYPGAAGILLTAAIIAGVLAVSYGLCCLYSWSGSALCVFFTMHRKKCDSAARLTKVQCRINMMMKLLLIMVAEYEKKYCKRQAGCCCCI